MPRMHFQVVPVLDLKDGRAVHAVGGRRDQYQPISSVRLAGSEPLPLARALCEALGLTTLYLADLDAIAGRPPSVGLYRQLMELGLDLWIDPGLREAGSVTPLLDLDGRHLRIIVGLETVAG